MGNIYLGQQKVQLGGQTTCEQPFLAAAAVDQILDALVEALQEPRERVDYLIATIGLRESDLPRHLRSLRTVLTPPAIADARAHVKARLALSDIRLSYTIHVSEVGGNGDNFDEAGIDLRTYKLLGLESARTHVDLAALWGVGVRCDLTVFSLPTAGPYLYPLAPAEAAAPQPPSDKAPATERYSESNGEYDEAPGPSRQTAGPLGPGPDTEVITPEPALAPRWLPESGADLYRSCRGRLFEFRWAADLNVNFSIFNVNRILNLYTAECVFVAE